MTKLTDLVGAVAPALGMALGGPSGAFIAGGVAKFLGLSSDNAEDIMSYLISNPDKLILLKQFEADLYATEVDDRISARNRQVELAKAGVKENITSILAIGFLIIYALIEGYCVLHPELQNNNISARIQDIFVMIISFYFGSSHRKGTL